MMKSDIELLDQLNPVNVSTQLLDKINLKIIERQRDRFSQSTLYSLTVAIVLLISLNGVYIYKNVNDKSTLENNIVLKMTLMDDNNLYK
ncbi:MAG: hypothetical protein IPN14_05205 [Bacteroidetes bacterium]|jgi:hypothetical protein|nr:hypothetical protein [Bacteroidota bacterium]MBK9481917.1 hypothetical protein [Bacteroidota bacterium]